MTIDNKSINMNKLFTSFTALVCLTLSAFADRAMPGIWQVKKLAEPYSEEWEPEYEQPIGDYVKPRPVLIHPRTKREYVTWNVMVRFA